MKNEINRHNITPLCMACDNLHETWNGRHECLDNSLGCYVLLNEEEKEHEIVLGEKTELLEETNKIADEVFELMKVHSTRLLTENQSLENVTRMLVGALIQVVGYHIRYKSECKKTMLDSTIKALDGLVNMENTNEKES
jgi:hypothetical protein